MQSMGSQRVGHDRVTEHTKGLLAGSSPVRKAWDCLCFTVKIQRLEVKQLVLNHVACERQRQAGDLLTPVHHAHQQVVPHG